MNKRVSALYDRHEALGANLDDWNGMDVAWGYATDPRDEHDAVREAAGLFDVSGLRKVHIRGKDALGVVDHIITRDLTKIYPGKSAYGPILTEDGTICDDAIIANNGGNDWLVVHGTGECMQRLKESGHGKDVSILFDDDLHDISLQGPKAVEFLDKHTPINLPALKYFHHQKTTLFGHDCVLSRTGYSGERGYEIFATAANVVAIWDAILKRGKSIGILPCSFTCLDKIRVEAALLFYPYDMTKANTPWEVGLDWALSKDGSYRGKEAVFASKNREKVKLVGIVARHDHALTGEEKLCKGGDEVGTVNSPAFSHRMNKSLALCHVRPDLSQVGTELVVRGSDVETTATIERIPFFDPEKERAHA